MTDTQDMEYDDDMISVLEAVWGEGFLSPGGTAEIDRVVGDKDLTGTAILDIGCGIGGAAIHLAKTRQPKHITGIDIEQNLVDEAQALADKNKVSHICQFQRVDPGPLPFESESFDVVFSKDAIIHIPDKAGLAKTVYEVLRPGGWFMASDWLCGYEGDPSPQMQAYIEAEGLDFALASPHAYEQALKTAGFVDIEIVERNSWYRKQARIERDNMTGPLYPNLVEKVGKDYLDRAIDVWNKMIVVLDSGEHQPTHLRARKPA